MTDVTVPSQNILDKMYEIIKRKEAHKKEGKDIAKLEAIYSYELEAIKSQIHTTANGDMVLISSMEDDHLLNTVKMILRHHKGNYKAIPKQYMDEVKSRPGMIDQLITYEPVVESNFVIEDYVDIPF